jgi:hypothetical protein
MTAAVFTLSAAAPPASIAAGSTGSPMIHYLNYRRSEGEGGGFFGGEMGFGEVGNGVWRRGLSYAPRPPLPRHVCLHVTDASSPLPRYSPRHPRIRTKYCITDSRVARYTQR